MLKLSMAGFYRASLDTVSWWMNFLGPWVLKDPNTAAHPSRCPFLLNEATDRFPRSTFVILPLNRHHSWLHTWFGSIHTRIFPQPHLSTCLQPESLEATIKIKKNYLILWEFTRRGVVLTNCSVSCCHGTGWFILQSSIWITWTTSVSQPTVNNFGVCYVSGGDRIMMALFAFFWLSVFFLIGL